MLTRRDMTIVLVLILYSLCLNTRPVVSSTLAPVYWNSSNYVFKSSKNSHLIEVSLNDEIDFVCPFYEDVMRETRVEYYIVHQVKEKNYRTCHIGDNDSPIVILNCSNPLQKKRFTLLFESFQAIPNVPEFVPGGKYYFITTSTGQYEGLMNTHQGACQSNHMKLTVSVCCQSTTPSHRFHQFVQAAGTSRHTKFQQSHKSSTSNKSHHILWRKRNRNLATPPVPKHDLLSSMSGTSREIGPAHCLFTTASSLTLLHFFNR